MSSLKRMLKRNEAILPRFKDRRQRMIAVLSAAERAALNRLLNKLCERDDEWAREL